MINEEEKPEAENKEEVSPTSQKENTDTEGNKEAPQNQDDITDEVKTEEASLDTENPEEKGDAHLGAENIDLKEAPEDSTAPEAPEAKVEGKSSKVEDPAKAAVPPSSPKPNKPALHTSLSNERRVLVVDEAGDRRTETIEIIKQVLTNVVIDTADDPEQAQGVVEKNEYDTCVVNFLMPGYSSSDFVKNIANDPAHPLLVGFSADKMSDAYDPKKGIKIKPLRRIFEIDALKDDDDDEFSTEEEEEEE